MVEAPQPRTVARRGRTARERLLIHGRREALSGAAALMDGTSRVIKRLPLPARYLPSDAVTLPLGVLWATRRPVIERNYATMLGVPVSDPRVRALARASIRNFGRMAIDFLTVRTMSDTEILTWVSSVGEHYLEDALGKGRGVVLALSHLGSWDVAAAFAEARGWHLTVVTEANWAAELVAGARRGRGLALAPREGSLRELFRALARNECVAILCDVAPSGLPTINVSFFGRPAPFPVGPARLAQHTGAAVVPAACVRLPDHRYRIEAQPALFPERSRSDEALAALTAAIASASERFIRACPEQWYPFHPIWPQESG